MVIYFAGDFVNTHSSLRGPLTLQVKNILFSYKSEYIITIVHCAAV